MNERWLDKSSQKLFSGKLQVWWGTWFLVTKAGDVCTQRLELNEGRQPGLGSGCNSSRIFFDFIFKFLNLQSPRAFPKT